MLCQIGDIEVWRILDLVGPFLPPSELFPDAGDNIAEIIESHAPGSLHPTGALILPVQGFLLKTPDHVILVDACVGNDKTANYPSWHQRNDTRFLSSLSAAGIGPNDVDYVLCTHLHVDHVGWNTRLEDGRWVPTFPNAKYLLPEADNTEFSQQGTDSYRESVAPVIASGQAELVGPDHKLGDYVTLIPTPGHTPGHVSVQLQSNDARAIITGDALHTTAQCWHPEWQFKYDANGPKAVTSRIALLQTASESGDKVLGSHFSLPSIGRVKAKGDGFEWVPD